MTDSTFFNNHPEFLIEVDRIAVRLIEMAGAFTVPALRRALPFSGYSVEECRIALDVIVKRGHLSIVNSIYIADPMWSDGGVLVTAPNPDGAWTVDVDEEFGGPLLRWNDRVIAQVTGEEQDGIHEAYAALVRLVQDASECAS